MTKRFMWLVTAILLCQFGSASPITVMIDPGHGGHGARKFGSNGGNGNGAVGPIDTLTEQWVNLRVALIVGDIMDGRPPEPTVIFTRDQDTMDVSISQRIQKAKDFNANYFISIHHNGLTLNAQGTEVWWDSTSRTDDSNLVRVPEARDSVFAKKALLRIRDMWRYTNRCSTQNNGNWMQGCNCAGRDNFALLHRTRHCPCILTEASNLYNNAEEAAFADEYNPHAGQEADAVYHGWHSYHANMGIAQISNRYLGTRSGTVLVDTTTWTAPVEFCWEALEQHFIQAQWDFWENGYFYTFHHWAHYTAPPFSYPAETNTARFWWFSVSPEWEYHIYRAFFTGGPYFCNLYDPNWGGIYDMGDTVWVGYGCSVGVDSSSLVDVFLDRHNGHGGFNELVAQNVPYANGVRWAITGPLSDSCLMKIVVHDVAGNVTSTISQYMLSINPCGWIVGDPNGDGSRDISDAVYLILRIFINGPAPVPHPLGSGDYNCDKAIDISDAVSIISYIFTGGAAPRCTCEDYSGRSWPRPVEQRAEARTIN